jgi:predicted outer membrane lipoprotein
MGEADETLQFSVDPEHGGLRMAVLICFIGVGAVSFAIVSGIFASLSFGVLLAAAIAIIAAMTVTRAVESRLKNRWPSGRVLEVTPSTVRFALKGETQREIDPTQHVNVLMWRFPINRRTRIPKGWYVVSLALMQENIYIAVYTFMSPEDFKDFPMSEQYVLLTPPKKQETDIRLAGQQRRLREAEVWRWNEGAEVSKEDFMSYVNRLQAQFPSWMVGGA